MTKAASYEPCDCNAGDCDILDLDVAEPCWGSVEAIDELFTDDGDSYWTHRCAGHDIGRHEHWTGRYQEEPQP